MDLIVSQPLAQPVEEGPPALVGCSESIRAIEHEADYAALSDAHVLITGEAGVEKEAVARLIHDRSLRAPSVLVTVSCAGLPDVLLESELFGHMRGSFRGAYRDKAGLLELSPNGSLFLDEVDELSPTMQGVLLRFLESGEVQRVGAPYAHANVNVRVIAATSGDLDAQVAAGLFREDLYALLNGVRLPIPPLRDRTEDIPLLADYFLGSARRFCGARARTLSAAVLRALTAYRWPGNVRELQEVVEWMALRARGPVIQLSEIPAQVFRREPEAGRFPRASPVSHRGREFV